MGFLLEEWDIGSALTFGYQPPDLFGNVQPGPNEHEHATNRYTHLLQDQLQLDT